MLLIIGRVALVTGVAGYSHQTSRGRSVGLSVRRSVGLYVRTCVGLSSALWKNGGSDPNGIIVRTGPEMRQVVGFGDRFTEKGTFGANLERALVTNWGLTFAATRPSSQITLGRLVMY